MRPIVSILKYRQNLAKGKKYFLQRINWVQSTLAKLKFVEKFLRSNHDVNHIHLLVWNGLKNLVDGGDIPTMLAHTIIYSQNSLGLDKVLYLHQARMSCQTLQLPFIESLPSSFNNNRCWLTRIFLFYNFLATNLRIFKGHTCNASRKRDGRFKNR